MKRFRAESADKHHYVVRYLCFCPKEHATDQRNRNIIVHRTDMIQHLTFIVAIIVESEIREWHAIRSEIRRTERSALKFRIKYREINRSMEIILVS